MFNCPDCKKYRMSRRFVGNLPLYWCPSCDSIGIVGRYLKNILSSKTYKFLRENRRTFKDSPSRECPSCFKKFKLANYKHQNEITEIDFCPKCMFLYLDKGEIAKIKFDAQNVTNATNESILDVMSYGDAFRERGIEKSILGLPDIKSDYKAVIEYPIGTLLISLTCILIFKYPELNNSLAFSTEEFNIINFFMHHLGHVNLPHLLGNLFGFLVFSSYLERFIGTKKTLILYFEVIIMSSIAYFLFGPDKPVLGGSAVIFGAFGALMSLMPNARISIYRFAYIFLRYLRMLKFTFPFYVFFGFYLMAEVYMANRYGFSKGISHFSHIVGFLSGYIFSMGIPLQKLKPKKKKT